MLVNVGVWGECVLPTLRVGSHSGRDKGGLSMKAGYDKLWHAIMNVFGFGHVHSTQKIQIARLETNVNWLIRGYWVLLAAIIVRPFFA